VILEVHLNLLLDFKGQIPDLQTTVLGNELANGTVDKPRAFRVNAEHSEVIRAEAQAASSACQSGASVREPQASNIQHCHPA